MMAPESEPLDAFIVQAFEEHQRFLRGYFRRTLQDSDADDCLQEVFHKAWHCREQLQDRGNVQGWLWGIARTVRADGYRRSGRQPVVGSDRPELPTDSADGPLACLERADTQRRVREALHGLAKDDPNLNGQTRTARLRLHEVAQDWLSESGREYTARRLKCSIKSVERARRSLRTALVQQLVDL